MTWPFKRQSGPSRQVGVVLDAAIGGAVAVIEHRGRRRQLQHFAHCGPSGGSAWPLSDLIDGHSGLTTAVIDHQSYQLLLVECPDVPPDEVAQAVRWRLRELISFPLDQAVVDVFDVPSQARGNRKMVYAVAAEAQVTDELATQLREARAALHAIDIPELCLRNIATQLEQDKFGVACLLVQGTRGVLTLSREQNLYLVRQMEVPLEAATDADAIAQVALEVQRSLDYFESHYDQRPIRDVLLAPSPAAGALSGALDREMAVNVSLLDLNELVEAPTPLSAEEQSVGLLAVGAALRGPDVLEQAA